MSQAPPPTPRQNPNCSASPHRPYSANHNPLLSFTNSLFELKDLCFLHINARKTEASCKTASVAAVETWMDHDLPQEGPRRCADHQRWFDKHSALGQAQYLVGHMLLELNRSWTTWLTIVCNENRLRHMTWPQKSLTASV